jgi:phospholipase A1
MHAGVGDASERKNLLEVAQTIALLSTISEREKDQNVVTLSTLHASKGLEWPHVVLAGCVEGMLPFKPEDADGGVVSESFVQRLQEERRLMYVGITRAQRSLAVSWSKKRKKGRELVPAQPSRFIAEMALDQTTSRKTRARSSRPARGIREEERGNGGGRGGAASERGMKRLACVALLLGSWGWRQAPTPLRRARDRRDRPAADLLGLWRAEFEGLRPSAPRCCWKSTPSTRAASAAPSTATASARNWPATSRRRVHAGRVRRRRAHRRTWVGELVEGSCGARSAGRGRRKRRIRRGRSCCASRLTIAPRHAEARLVLAAVALLPLPPLVHAQAQTPAGRPALPSAIRRDRLACFDRWAERQQPPTPALAPAPAPRCRHPSPPAAAREDTVCSACASPSEGCHDAAFSELSRFWELEPGAELRHLRHTRLPADLGRRGHGEQHQRTAHLRQPDEHATTASDYRKVETRLQLSVRTKIAQNMFTRDATTAQDSLWFAYSQQSYWQIFTPTLSRPFRSTDHEPELIYILPLQSADRDSWRLRFGGLGLVHQSNGQSLPYSRSWNRVYLMAGAESGRLLLQARAWRRLPEDAASDDNPGIGTLSGAGN